MKLLAGATSDVGQVREKNEDSFLVDDRLALFAVADGMGGHRGGAVASSTSLEALRASVASGDEISDAVQSANDAVFEAASDDPELAGMGTTLTAAVAIDGSTLLVGHVGDSRAYLVRGDDMAQVTEDHSLVEELVREGRLTRAQADVHPQRSIITRALGVEPIIAVDLYAIRPENGDRLVLCSDGLTTMLRDREIVGILRAESDPRAAADLLVDAANEAGGEDNITAVVIVVTEVDGSAPDAAMIVATAEAAIQPAARTTPVSSPGVEPWSPGALDAPPPSGDDDEDELVVTTTGGRSRVSAVLLIVVPIFVLIIVAIVAVGWYARRSYYVGIDDGEVVLYQGVPGGVLGWDPTVEHRTGLLVEDLTSADATDLANGAAQGSRSRAEEYIEQIDERTEAAVAATSTTTTTTSTTTTPPTTTRRTTTSAPTVTTASPTTSS